jgi:hypothetical protein
LRAWGTWLAAFSLAGCAGAEWRNVEIESGYQRPKAVTVTVIASPATKEAADALAAGVVDELHSCGVKATVVSETSDTSDASLRIVKWDPGSQSLRWLVGFGEGKAKIVVAVSGTVGVEGTVDGWVTGGLFGGTSDGAPAAAGHLIGKTIATGRREEPGARSRPCD